MNDLPVLILKKNEERRLRAGHMWIYSNEVDTAKSPLAGFEPGAAAMIQSANGQALGAAYVNPHSLICARLYSRRPRTALDADFFERRIRSALALRESLFERPFYRMVFGESDGLPGLVVDRYDTVLAVQITTAGMERVRDVILDVLQRIVAPAGIQMLNDNPVRTREGLHLDSQVIGSVPDKMILEEGGARFEVPLAGGQKTGWFFDQRDNRLAMHKYVKDRQVLDVFSYIGAFGVQAAKAGAAGVCCVESSKSALEAIGENAKLSGVEDRLRVAGGDAFDTLGAMKETDQRFDVVIVDPPAFIKRRKDIKSGEKGYARLNRLAMQLLAPDGILISCSCSMHLSESRLQSILLGSARKLARNLQIIERGFQSIDHPVHPAIPETAYLKSLTCRIPAT